MQITDRNSGLWFAERQWEHFRSMKSCKVRTKMSYGNFEKKSFLQCQKDWLHVTSSGTFSFFSCLYLLIINHKIFLSLKLLCYFRFWKTHSCNLTPNWTRNRMITYANNIKINHSHLVINLRGKFSTLSTRFENACPFCFVSFCFFVCLFFVCLFFFFLCFFQRNID